MWIIFCVRKNFGTNQILFVLQVFRVVFTAVEWLFLFCMVSIQLMFWTSLGIGHRINTYLLQINKR